MPLKLEDIGKCMTDALRDQESTALIRLVFVKHFLHLIKHLSCKVYFIRAQYTHKIFDNISPLLILNHSTRLLSPSVFLRFGSCIL